MRFIICFAFGFFGMCSMANAQLAITSFPFSTENSNVRSLSLGNAVVSLGGEYGDSNINPAGVGLPNTFQLSASPERFAHDWGYYALSGVYGLPISAISLSVRMMNAVDIAHARYPETMPKFQNSEVYVKAGYSLRINEKLKIGAALNYYYSSEASGARTVGIAAQRTPSSYSWGVDIGAQYQTKEWRTNSFGVQPTFGLSLTNFGKSTEYYDRESTYSLPTTLRAGASITGISAKNVWGQNLVEISLMQDVSKFMVRQELKRSGDDVQRKAMNPFKALFKSWDKIEFYAGRELPTIPLGRQLWWHSGVELKLLNTFALRGGYQQAGKIESHLSYWSLGIGVDLYYLAFDYAWADYSEDFNPPGSYVKGRHWQLTGRIPLDGKRPDTILNHIFN